MLMILIDRLISCQNIKHLCWSIITGDVVVQKERTNNKNEGHANSYSWKNICSYKESILHNLIRLFSRLGNFRGIGFYRTLRYVWLELHKRSDYMNQRSLTVHEKSKFILVSFAEILES